MGLWPSVTAKPPAGNMLLGTVVSVGVAAEDFETTRPWDGDVTWAGEVT